jgi:excisionase family DNA binding protein
MVTCYRTNGRGLRYDCTHHQVNYGAPRCQSLSGAALDALIADLVLEVLRPAAIEVSLAMAEDIELERTARHRQWALRLEQARYEAERAERQHNAAEPENRLVVRSLERRWEEALAAEARLREEHRRFLAREPIQLSPGDRDAIRRLSGDVPGLWHAETTTGAERKEIARLLLERVEVTLRGDTENADATCVWAGGRRSSHALVRSVRRTTQLARHAELLERIRALHREGRRPPAITRTLVVEGWRSAHGKPYRASGVRSLMTRMGLIPARLARPTAVVARNEGEFTPAEIAARLNMPEGTVYSWLHKGRLAARRAEAADRSLWLIRLADVERLLLQRGPNGRLPPRRPS